MNLKLYIRLIVFSSLFLILSCSNSSSKDMEYQGSLDFASYKTNNFTISYPKTWQIKSAGNIVAFTTSLENKEDTFAENVNISIQDLSTQPMTLDQYTALSKGQIAAAMGASSILSVKRIAIDGKPADEMIYKMNYQGKSLKVKGVWLIEDKKAYVITYTAEPNKFDKYLSDADKTIKSFKII
jgi:hypothetical protein